ncbi:Scr1 family TA system antitoxin-like transcriptional regulator [Actinomadura sp. 9N407]|uniref:Scr1 family TA system antitoxin-like transcriptional regulator n=1 Tax=Actinomadura sp. 9N407 TaxID=3375154 RepID=UPI0037BCD668
MAAIQRSTRRSRLGAVVPRVTSPWGFCVRTTPRLSRPGGVVSLTCRDRRKLDPPQTWRLLYVIKRSLQAWRKQAGLSKVELSKALGYTDSYIGQIELCKNLPSLELAEAFDTYFKTNGLFVRLRERILETRHISLLPPGFAEYAKKEEEASSLRNYELAIVNGILQTEDYARTVMSSNQVPLDL